MLHLKNFKYLLHIHCTFQCFACWKPGPVLHNNCNLSGINCVYPAPVVQLDKPEPRRFGGYSIHPCAAGEGTEKSLLPVLDSSQRSGCVTAQLRLLYNLRKVGTLCFRELLAKACLELII